MKSRITRLVAPIVLSVVIGAAVYAALRFSAPRPRSSETTATNAAVEDSAPFDSQRWLDAIEKAKADRAGFGSNVALNVPAQLKHYEERHWFLAAQVAEVKKHNLQTCQDYVDLAAMIKRGEMMAVPAVTDDFVLMGVGAKTDDGPFTKYEDDQSIPLYDESQLREQSERLKVARPKAAPEKKPTPGKQKNAKQAEKTQKPEDSAAQSNSSAAQPSNFQKYYDQPGERERLFADYASIQALGQNFRGRSYDLESANDRQALKMTMLSSLRPTALKVLQEVAHDYRVQFDRPLPISSLVRPEQYQHTLRRYNRAATTIETPPHSTGLAFDIDYRYMSVAEQNFVMADLARLKDAGRIEVLRERNANFHVFAFIDGVRPSDDLITASLQDAGAPPPEEVEKKEPPPKKPAKVENKKKAPEKSQRHVKRR
ncbi:MAG TPA: DUF5715 family protein [Pyrinomonadaceae bacterium]|nr:DUF5715 family protein [Pyrinomonadaceae bacterium]